MISLAKKVLLLISMLACTLASASSLYVSASGQFSSSDVASQLVAPNAKFLLTFVVDTNPTPLPGSVTSLGFDVPVQAFSYALNGSSVSALPSEIRFNTLANGGLFDVTFGSGFNAPEFSFQGAQAFSGLTSSPAFSSGTYSLSGWTYSDASNYDSQTAGAVSLAPTPEPRSVLLILCGLAAVFVPDLRKVVAEESEK